MSEAINKTSLFDWISLHHSEDELRNIFVNMDIALKYIHEHGYCVEVFYPTEIFVLNNDSNYIEFSKLIELSNNSLVKRDMIREDIFNSSLLQIGIYTNTLNNITPEFARENFESISQFLPPEDVPYYKGIIQRGSSVYFCEYVSEKRNRDLVQLEQELGNEDTGSMQFSKGINFDTYNKINDKIYRQINGLRDGAFINFLLVPTVSLLSLMLIGIISWIISLF